MVVQFLLDSNQGGTAGPSRPWQILVREERGLFYSQELLDLVLVKKKEGL